MKSTNENYEVTYCCPNCHKRFAKNYKKGERAKEIVDCKHCECYGARKTWGDLSK